MSVTIPQTIHFLTQQLSSAKKSHKILTLNTECKQHWFKSLKLICLLANTFRGSYSQHLVQTLDTELAVDWLVLSIKKKKTNSCIILGSVSDNLGLDPWHAAQRDSRPHLYNRKPGQAKAVFWQVVFPPTGRLNTSAESQGPPQPAHSPSGLNIPLLLGNSTPVPNQWNSEEQLLSQNRDTQWRKVCRGNEAN